MRLADALFSPVQQRVLGLLFGQPDRRFQSAELIRLAHGGIGAVHRQIERLEAVGLVDVTRTGNQKHYQASRTSPIFAELHSLAIKTVGIAEPLRRALEPYTERIQAAFVYGSIAKGADTARSDIDLMVISDDLRYPDIFDAMRQVEAELARPVSPTVMSTAQWRAKRSRRGSFAAKIAAQPRIFVIGSDDDIR
ncbi:MAG: transcriptional regulator [Acidobacteria bacterium]|nr:MAG: transcriptional regulator [Acidobacteriota bacterium]